MTFIGYKYKVERNNTKDYVKVGHTPHNSKYIQAFLEKKHLNKKHLNSTIDVQNNGNVTYASIGLRLEKKRCFK